LTSLEVRQLSVAYGKVVVLQDIDLSVEAGSVVCILGANGAGKSSFLKCLVGLVPARSGRIVWEGKDITNLEPHEAATNGIALSPEGRRLFPDLSVYENLCVGGYHRRRNAAFRDDLEKVMTYFPRLRERLHTPAGYLSGGEQQMAAIGRALMIRPRLLLLDEPSLGLAPLIVSQMARIISALHRDGMTIVLVEQNARLALRLAQYGYVFETGRLALAGPSSELASNPYVKELYLGGGSSKSRGSVGAAPERRV